MRDCRYVGARVSPDLYRELAEHAERNCRSLSRDAEFLLAEALRRERERTVACG